MKYTVEGFSQQKLIELGLGIEDAMILRWFVDFRDTDRMSKEIHDGKEYCWIKHGKIIEDLPILGITTPKNISRHLSRLVACGVMVKYLKKYAGGTYTYYRINEDTYSGLVAQSPVASGGRGQKSPVAEDISGHPNYSSIIDSSISDKDSTKPKRPPRHQSDFDEYWNSYPPTKNKVSKSTAYKAYVKKRDEGITKEDLLAALEIYKEECKGFSDSKYIRCPHRTIEQYTPPLQPKKREEEPVLKRFEHHVMLQMRLRDDGDAYDSALIDLYMDRESDEAMEAYAKKWADTGDWR